MAKNEFHNFLKNIDKNFYLDAYFAQDKQGSFFSKLMPKNIKNKKVLEIGCGLGAHTEALVQKKAIVTSIDLAPTSIKVTKKKIRFKKLKS